MLDYMIYIVVFAIGSILGLLYSYKLHGEPYVANTEFNVLLAVGSVVGWCLGFLSNNIVLATIGFLVAGFVMGGRPGYGRKETACGLIVAVVLYLLLKSGML